MCGEKQKKGGTHYAQDCMDVVMATPVCLMVWGVFIKKGLVQSQMQKEILTRLSVLDILDNNLLPIVLKLENYQWIFQDDSVPGTPVRTDKIVERQQ